MNKTSWEGRGQTDVARGGVRGPRGDIAARVPGPPRDKPRVPVPGPGPAPLLPEDAELVRRSQRGDRAAFEELVRRTARPLYARLYLDCGDAHRAEDLVQETYLVAWRSIAQVSEPAGFRKWLFSIGHTVLIDASRREGRRKRTGRRAAGDPTDVMSGVPDPHPSPPESVGRAEERQRVLATLRSMPEEYRLPLTLRYLGGADYESIGQQLGVSNGSLRGLLSRGMARLRERLEQC